MDIKHRILMITLTFLAFLIACVDPFQVEILSAKTYIIVDGTLTNIAEAQNIRLFKAQDATVYKSSEYTGTITPPVNGFSPLTGLEVRVLENQNQYYLTQEIAPGVYQLPEGFVGKVNRTYQLLFEHEGNQYESNPERMISVPSIDEIQTRYNAEGRPSSYARNRILPTYDFFIDFQDPADEQNFYQWQWVDYESQNYCETCQQSRYFLTDTIPGQSGFCRPDKDLNAFRLFDYECESLCWDTFTSEDINIFSDLNTNGLPQKGKLVAQIPVFQSNACLVSIRQSSLTPLAYRYYKLAQEQSFTSGSLADTPPSPNRSNVRNLGNPQDLVLGFFTASAVSESRFMLSRDEATGVVENGLFSVINNRAPFLETSNFGRLRIPKATCVESLSRSGDAPLNWQFGF